jgi:hypothetical protein
LLVFAYNPQNYNTRILNFETKIIFQTSLKCNGSAVTKQWLFFWSHISCFKQIRNSIQHIKQMLQIQLVVLNVMAILKSVSMLIEESAVFLASLKIRFITEAQKSNSLDKFNFSPTTKFNRNPSLLDIKYTDRRTGSNFPVHLYLNKHNTNATKNVYTRTIFKARNCRSQTMSQNQKTLDNSTYKNIAGIGAVGAAVRLGSRVQAEVSPEMRCHPGSEGTMRALVGLLHQVHCVVPVGEMRTLQIWYIPISL